jgi:hypothetical protein
VSTDKIRKLLRLAASKSNPHEAATAYAMAQRLATLHHLDLDEITTEDDKPEPPSRKVAAMFVRTIDTWKQRSGWRMTIAQACAQANNCRTYHSRGRDGVRQKVYGQLVDLDRVETLYHQITTACDAQARAAVREYKARGDLDPRWDDSPRAFGAAWRVGYAHAILDRMPSPETVVEEQRAIAGSRTTALVRVDNALDYLKKVGEALDAKHDNLGLVDARGLTGPSSSAGYVAGRRAGKSANVGPIKAVTS